MKKIFGIFLITLLLVSCNSSAQTSDTSKIIVQELSSKQKEVSKQEAPASYEYKLDDLFVIKKLGNDDYEIIAIEPFLSFHIFTKTDKGFLFSYSHPKKENGEYTDGHSGYYCHFDEYTQTLTKIYDTSLIHYPQEVVWNDNIYFVDHDEQSNPIVMELTATKGVKKVFEVKGYNPIKLMTFENSMLIAYKENGVNYLKRMDLPSYKITSIFEEKKDNKFYEVSVISASEHNGRIYYSLGKLTKDKKYKYELAEYSIKKGKEVKRYPLKNGFDNFVFKDDIFVFDEINQNEVRTNTLTDIIIAKKAGNKFNKIESYIPQYGLLNSYIDGDDIYFRKVQGICKLNTKKLGIDWVYFPEKDGYSVYLGKEIILTKYFKSEERVGELEKITYKFTTFDKLKAKYGN